MSVFKLAFKSITDSWPKFTFVQRLAWVILFVILYPMTVLAVIYGSQKERG